MSTVIQNNIVDVYERIERACNTVDRKSDEISLIVVTKTISVERVFEAYQCGLHNFGENKVQEAREKFARMAEIAPDKHIHRHFIGHLQTNKVKDVIQFADMIQSVDRVDLAQKLEDRLTGEDRNIDILIQVNSSYEASKSGIEPENAMDFIEKVAKMPHLKIKGLMTIGANTQDEKKVHKSFAIVRDIAEKIKAQNLSNGEMNILSMGMSHDLEIAIQEGSTMLRIGTAIFGNR